MKSNSEWKLWGKLDPLYGVAAVPGKALGDREPWTEQEFFAIGDEYCQAFLGLWSRYGVTHGSCVEIGCGAGRLTRPLGRVFHTVDAIDVSADMIEIARKHASPNVSFHVTDGMTLPLADASADAAFSCHVFQHFGSLRDAAINLREIHRVLSPGGTLMVHLPVVAWPSGPFGKLHNAVEQLRQATSGLKFRARNLLFALGLVRQPPMRMLFYRPSWLYHTLKTIGFDDIELSHLFLTTHFTESLHPFVLARRTA